MLDELDLIIYNEAKELGIFEGIDANEVYTSDSFLSENQGFRKQNIHTMDKATRLKWLKSRSALALAKQKNDPLYAKLVKFSRLRKKYISMLNAKYQSGANVKAKELIKKYKSNSGSLFTQKPAINTPKAGGGGNSPITNKSTFTR